MSCLLSSLNDINNTLSKCQSSCITGPLLASPAKALVSVAQIVVGVAEAVLAIIGIAVNIISCPCFPISLLFGTPTIVGAAYYVGLGALQLLYSTGNVVSLGFLAQCIEN